MSFPRGGLKAEASFSKPLSTAADDVLFGNRKRLARIEDKSGQSKKKARTEQAAVASLAQAVGAGMTTKLAGSAKLKVEAIVFNKFQPGCQALGFVLQVMSDRAVVSLPGGSVGTVKVSEVSDAAFRMMQVYTDEMKHKRDLARSSGKKFNPATQVKAPKPDISLLLAPRQMVRVVVLEQVETETSKKRAIDLSCRSSLLNRGLPMKCIKSEYPLSGCIVSKEDHGYILSAGLADASLFLPHKNVPANMGELEIGKSNLKPFLIFLYLNGAMMTILALYLRSGVTTSLLVQTTLSIRSELRSSFASVFLLQSFFTVTNILFLTHN